MNKRVWIKSLTWNLLATVITFLSVLLYTGSTDEAAGITLITRAIKIVLFPLHEKWWKDA